MEENIENLENDETQQAPIVQNEGQYNIEEVKEEDFTPGTSMQYLKNLNSSKAEKNAKQSSNYDDLPENSQFKDGKTGDLEESIAVTNKDTKNESSDDRSSKKHTYNKSETDEVNVRNPEDAEKHSKTTLSKDTKSVSRITGDKQIAEGNNDDSKSETSNKNNDDEDYTNKESKTTYTAHDIKTESSKPQVIPEATMVGGTPKKNTPVKKSEEENRSNNSFEQKHVLDQKKDHKSQNILVKHDSKFDSNSNSTSSNYELVTRKKDGAGFLSSNINNYFGLFDYLFPSGSLSRLAKIYKMTEVEDNSLIDILEKFDFQKPLPVIVLCGARDSNRQHFYEGLCRCAFRTDSVIIDSGVKTGLESAAERRNLKVVGVFPGSQTTFPRANTHNGNLKLTDPKTTMATKATERNDITQITEIEQFSTELTSAHTHLFMVDDRNFQKWGTEAKLKMKIAENISKGNLESRAKNFQNCKIIMVLMGDNPYIKEEIKIAVSMNLSIIVVKGSEFTDKIIGHLNGEQTIQSEPFRELINRGNFYPLESSKTEDISAFAHFFLSVSPF